MDSVKEKASYCLGLLTGNNLKSQFADLNIPYALQGMQDALEGETPKLEKEEISNILQSIDAQMEQQKKETFKKLSAVNKEQGIAFLEKNKEMEGVHVLPSGLQYKILSRGNDQQDSPSLFDVVKIHYNGFSLDGRALESSYARGEPVTIPVNQAISGWAEALQKMHIGDKWKLFVPSYLAYGASGVPPYIGPDQTLIFELELIGIQPKTG